jgi:DNA replication and repair protein RecF
MAITRLSLSDFRNHEDFLLEPEKPFVVLTGENGAGKTNVLEAISLLAPGRGLRRAPLADMVRIGQQGFAVAARMDGSDLATGVSADAPGKRQVRVNGAASSASALAEWLSVIWITPAMDRLFMDGASDRRRFLDRLVLAMEPGHAHHASRYEAAMRQRNRLLGGELQPDPAWLSALETQMAEHGLAIAQARAAMVEALRGVLDDAPAGPFARASITLDSGEALEDLAARLRASRPLDAAAGRTLVGPHRTDLAVNHAGKGQPAARCSTGEQKALLIGIVLGHARLVAARTGKPPLLLLDEVAAHLDPVRRAALYDRLALQGGQCWLTGTELAPFAGLEASFVQIGA